MAFTDPRIPSATAERTEQLARLAYEDTERLVYEPPTELEWRAHLSYPRDLQRIGREILAEPIDTTR
jgi:hypothetical protein